MLQKIICIIYIIDIYALSLNALPLAEYNETNLLTSINSQLKELRTGLAKLQDGYLRESAGELLKLDIQFLRADFQFLRTEVEKLKKHEPEKDPIMQFLKANFQDLELKSLKESDIEKQKKPEDSIADFLTILNKYSWFFKPNGCVEAEKSGISNMLISNYSDRSFRVVCDMETQNGNWTIFLRRLDGSVDFYRNWTEYQNGFGDLNGEFFLGLDKIHAITSQRSQELLVILEDFEGVERFENYAEFGIGGETEEYALKTLGEANGTAGDSLRSHFNRKFATFDHDNENNCAKSYSGAWWYEHCHDSQLTGKYGDNSASMGINWRNFRGWDYSLKRVLMMMRPRM